MIVALIGATGMLGRPVARALAADGRLRVRALVRDPARARGLLPAGVDLVGGDLRDSGALSRALSGADAVYLSLNTPYSPREKFDPDRDGTRLVVEQARACGVGRILRLSALAVSLSDDPWWVLSRKAETDALVAGCGVPYTIFRPTWFMESLPLFVLGPLLMGVRTQDVPLHWISGEDYARQVQRAIVDDLAVNATVSIQGPEPVTFRNALGRFHARLPGQRLRVDMPRGVLGAAGMFLAKPRYLNDLLRVSLGCESQFVSGDAWNVLGRPSMTIEYYADSIKVTGDLPRK